MSGVAGQQEAGELKLLGSPRLSRVSLAGEDASYAAARKHLRACTDSRVPE